MEEQEIQTEQDTKEGGPEGEPGSQDSAKGGAGADLAKENEALKDKYVRLFAEFENFRRRTAKENFELVAAANQKLIGRLTDVLDTFELAFDPRHKAKDDRVEDFEKGVRLIYNKFKELLSDEGLEEIDPAGQDFDPNLHDALMQQPSDTVPENRIIQVLSKGYKVKGRILKHAKVIVSKGQA